MPRLAYLAVSCALFVAACSGGGKSTTPLPTQPAAGAPAAGGLVTLHGGTRFAIGMIPGRLVHSVMATTLPGVGHTVKFIVYYSTNEQGTQTLISSIASPLDQAEMKAAIRATAAGPGGGTVQDEMATTYQGFAARGARITGVTPGTDTAFLRIISTTNHAYLLQYVAGGDANRQTPPALYATFLSSLKIG